MLGLRMALLHKFLPPQWLEAAMPGAGEQAKAAGGHDGAECAATPPRRPEHSDGPSSPVLPWIGRVKDEL